MFCPIIELPPLVEIGDGGGTGAGGGTVPFLAPNIAHVLALMQKPRPGAEPPIWITHFVLGVRFIHTATAAGAPFRQTAALSTAASENVV